MTIVTQSVPDPAGRPGPALVTEQGALAHGLCPYCVSEIPAGARKCRHCGEWVGRTTRGIASALLRGVGWLWIALSAAAVVGFWRVASFWLDRLSLQAPDDNLPPPVVLHILMYVVVALFALQALVIGLGLVIFAGLAPRRPR